jgi:hypothetical protein
VAYLIEIEEFIFLFVFRFRELTSHARMSLKRALKAPVRIAVSMNRLGERRMRFLFPGNPQLKEAHDERTHAFCHRRRAY